MKKNKILLLIITSVYTLMPVLLLKAQEKVQVKGTIISIVDNKPLKDVNVRVEGVAGLYTTTDSIGHFVINVPSLKVTMVFTYPGYTENTILLDGRSDMLVKLVPIDYSSNLDQVPLAFRTQQKRFIAQSFSNLPDEAFRNRTYSNADRYLTGLVPGVNITAINGAPGAGANVNIRGISSIYAGNQPLYIIDGMEISSLRSDVLSTGSFNSELLNLNNEDIESVTVLKDAAAKALYGARGANGVVIIETYKGQKGNSKIDFTVGQGFDNIDKSMPLLNAAQSRTELLEMANSQYSNPNLVVQNYGAYLFNDPQSPYYQSYKNSTNWLSLVKRQGSYGNYHFRMRGGDDVSKYSFSLGLFDQNGVISNTDLQKLTARFNLDYNINKKMRYGNNLSFTRISQNRQMQMDSRYNPFLIAHLKSPITAPYQKDFNGVNKPLLEEYDFAGVSNPLAMVNGISNQNTSSTINGNVFFQYIVSKSFSIYTSVGLDHLNLQESVAVPQTGIAPVKNIHRFSEQNTNTNDLVDGKLEAIYNKKVNYVHSISAILGAQVLDNNFKSRLGRSFNSTSDNFTSLDQGTIKDSLASDAGEWLMLSTYANVNYVYSDKYIVDATFRVDGSSRFGIKNRFIGFPAVGLGWRISNEKFLRQVNWIDELKLRASYGFSGNDNIGDYSGKILYEPGNYKNLGGVALNQFANENLKPEIIREANLGLDWSVFNQGVNLSIDAYNRINTNLLVYENFPLESGYPQGFVNGGKLENRGIEVGLNIRAKTGKLLWNFGANLCYNKNKVLKLPPNTPMAVMNYNGFTAIAIEGQPLGTYYGYKTNGVFATDQEASALINGEGSNGYVYKYDQFKAGDVRFVDLNNDGIIDEKDKTYLGKSMPDYFGGFNASAGFKGIVLSALFDLQLGRQIVNALRSDLESMSDFSNQTIAVNRRWTQSGDITDIPRLSYGDPAGNNRFSDRWVENGSFMRLRNVSLTYTLPDQIINKMRLKKLQIYISAENVLTISNYLGYDPEFNHLNNSLLSGVDYASTPLTRSFLAGLRIGL